MKVTELERVYFTILLSLRLWLALSTTTAEGTNIVVDPTSGNDQLCLFPEQSQNSSIPPCRTLKYALGNVDCDCSHINESSTITYENIVISLVDGVHTVEDCISIIRGSNITIEAQNPGQAIIECSNDHFPSKESFETGLLSCSTVGLAFRGIVFQHCGPYTPNVFLNRSSDVLFESCVFRDNIGAPLRTQFVPSITLQGTLFLNNFNQAPADTDTDNTTISELFDSITTAGGFTYFSRNTSVNIQVINCSFINNSAGSNDANNTRPVLLKANGHGGGLLIRIAQANEARIVISHSTFHDNEAEVDGGAIYFSLSEEFSSSQITLKSNEFKNNQVKVSAGGAVSLNLFRDTFNNSFEVQDCVFTDNSANAGGAFGIALYDTGLDSIEHPDSVRIERCHFIRNRASNEGTAVGLFALVHVDEVGFPVTFVDCDFENNTSMGTTAEHSSALVAFRFPVNFQGHNIFYGNFGGGVTLLNTILRVQGTIVFHGNSATFGGGLAMDDRCLVEVQPNVNLTFINNVAEETGGAIHVTFPAIRYTTDIFNRLCFIQYSDPMGRDLPPHDWENVTVNFYNNSAGVSGAALYASDLQLCSWLGPEYTMDESIIFNYPENASETSPFHFDGNSLRTNGQIDERLATAPHRVHVIREHVLVQPGEMVILNLLATDQLHNSREAIFALEGPHGAETVDGLSTNNESVPYRVPAVQSLSEQADSCSSLNTSKDGVFSLTFSLPGTSGLVQSVEFNYSGCHPGYRLDTSSCLCVCDTAREDIVRCDSEGRYIYLRSGVWAGLEENGRSLITARVQPSYVSCNRDGQLPGCLYEFDNPNAQCSEGREGTLCGQCSEGYAVTLDLLSCISATDQCAVGLAVFIVLYGVVVLIALLAFIFNTELPNELKGFVFYAQVIGLVYRPFVVLQTSTSSIDPLGVFLNLLGFSLPLPVCVSPSLQAHHVALLGYITPIIGVLMVLGYAIGARCIRVLSNHSALKGITFLSIFIYKYIADTSFILISCSSSEYGFVFQYDGSQRCLSFAFGFFVLFGLLLVIFFVGPAPFAVGYICTKRPQRFQHYADVLTKGLKKDKRWFGGWDLGRRLPFVIIGYFTVQARPSLVLFLMSLVAMTVLLVHLLSKPYENKTINIIEALILVDLVAVTVIFIDPTDHPVPDWLRIILLLLPYVYASLYVIWMAISYIWRKYLTQLNCTVALVGKIKAIHTNNNTETVDEVALVNTASPQDTMQKIGERNSTSGGDSTGSRNSDQSSAKPTHNVVEQSFSYLREPLLDS